MSKTSRLSRAIYYLVRRALGAEVREGLSELVLAQGGALFHRGDSHERVDQVVRPAQGPRL